MHLEEQTTKRRSTAVDRYVGERLRRRRRQLGMTQAALAATVDLSFKQIRKYEQGLNRIGAGRLYRLAAALDVSVAYFFEELGEETRPFRREREDVETLARDFQAIALPKRRRAFLRLVKAIAASPALQRQWARRP